MPRVSVSLPARFCAAAAPRKASGCLSSAGSCSPHPLSPALLRTASHAFVMESPPKASTNSSSPPTLAFGAQQAGQQNLHQKDGNASDHPLRRSAREGTQIAKFQLKKDCLLVLHRGDITKWSVDGKTDAIVNAANTCMLGGGGVDGAIHRAAGPDLLKACLKLPLVRKNVRCQTGDAVITQGFRLPVSKIIHTVGPQYYVDEKPELLLENSYKSSVFLSKEHGIKYLAFPAISCGIYGYPYDKAAEIALDTLSKYSDDLKEVHFILFEEESWSTWLEKACKSFERLRAE